MGWKSETSSNTKNLWNLSLHKDDTSPTSAGKERRSIKRHSRGKHVQGTHRDLGIGLRKFQNSFELKPYKFLIRGAKIVSQKHRETRLVHTKKGVKLSREKSGAECGGLSWRYWRSGLERKARVCDDRGKKRSRESIGEVSWLPKVRASLCFSSFLSFFLCFGNRPSSWTGEDDPIPARMDGWMESTPSAIRGISLGCLIFWLIFWPMVGENRRLVHYQPMESSWPAQISNHRMAIRL